MGQNISFVKSKYLNSQILLTINSSFCSILLAAAAAAAKSLQSCPTFSEPMDCSPPGSSIHGIFQTRVLEWGAIAFSELYVLLLLSCFSCVWFCATPEMAAHQAPPSLGFSRQEHWSGLPFPSPMQESRKWKVKVKSLSRVRLYVTPCTAAYQAPPSMGFWSVVDLKHYVSSYYKP